MSLGVLARWVLLDRRTLVPWRDGPFSTNELWCLARWALLEGPLLPSTTGFCCDSSGDRIWWTDNKIDWERVG